MDVMKVLHLIDSLGYSGSARQVCLLAPALAAATGMSVEVCCLGPVEPWTQSLRDAGIRVHTLGWTRWFDPSVLWNLRAVLRESSADVIHVWRLPALRALAAVDRQRLTQIVISSPI